MYIKNFILLIFVIGGLMGYNTYSFEIYKRPLLDNKTSLVYFLTAESCCLGSIYCFNKSKECNQNYEHWSKVPNPVEASVCRLIRDVCKTASMVIIGLIPFFIYKGYYSHRSI